MPRRSRDIPTIGSALAAWTLATALAAPAPPAGPPRAETKAPKPWTAPASAAAVRNPVANDASSLARAKPLYEQYCLACHGAAGRGDGPVARRLGFSAGDLTDRSRMEGETDGGIFWKIATGRDPMPGFQKEMALSDEQIWDLVNYTRSLVREPKPDSPRD